MRMTMPAILALAVLVSTATAAPDETTAQGAYYRAYYAEVALRDFEAATEAYGTALALAEKEKRSDLAARARLGRARCHRECGTVEAAILDLKAALVLSPGLTEARALLTKLEAKPKGDGVGARLIELVNGLGLSTAGGPVAEARLDQIRHDLLLAGDKAIPALAAGLRARNGRVAGTCAALLAEMGTERSLETMVKAFADPEVVPTSLSGALYALPASPGGLRVFEVALGHPDDNIRFSALRHLPRKAKALAKNPDTAHALGRLIARTATDRNGAIRKQLLASAWPDEVVAPLVPVARRLLESDAESTRMRALNSFRRMRGLLKALQNEVVALVHEDPASQIRRFALQTLIEHTDSPELRRSVSLRALADPDMSVVNTAFGGLTRHAGPDRPPFTDAENIAQIFAFARRAISPPPGNTGLWNCARILLKNVPPEALSSRSSDVLALLEADAVLVGPDRKPNRGVTDFVREALETVPDDEIDDLGPRILDALVNVWDRARWVRTVIDMKWVAPKTLARAVADPEWEVRWQAYHALRLTATERTVLPELPHLATDLEEPETIQKRRWHGSAMAPLPVYRCALELLEHFPTKRNVDIIRSVWKTSEGDRHYFARATLVSAIGKEALPEVRADVANPKYASHARSDLLKLLDAGAVPEYLAYAIKRKSALKGIPWDWRNRYDANGKVKERRRVPAVSEAFLARFLAELPDDLVSGGLIDLVATSVSPETRRRLILVGLRSENPATLTVAAEQAGAYNLVAAWPLLVAALEKPEVEVRRAAKAALEEIRSYRELKAAFERFGEDDRGAALESAKALATHEDPVKRAGAAYALGALGEPSGVPVLLKLLGDADEKVRDAALAALERLGGRKR